MQQLSGPADVADRDRRSDSSHVSSGPTPVRSLALRVVSVFLLVVALVGGLAGTASAAPGMHSPDRARSIALGLIDATGPLAAQCGLGKIGEKIRARNVASAAVKDALAISGAKKSCSGVKNMVAAIGVIVGLAEVGRPVYITMSQSQKNKWWGAGLVKTCSVTVRTGVSASLAKNFTANFTCH